MVCRQEDNEEKFYGHRALVAVVMPLKKMKEKKMTLIFPRCVILDAWEQTTELA